MKSYLTIVKDSYEGTYACDIQSEDKAHVIGVGESATFSEALHDAHTRYKEYLRYKVLNKYLEANYNGSSCSERRVCSRC